MAATIRYLTVWRAQSPGKGAAYSCSRCGSVIANMPNAAGVLVDDRRTHTAWHAAEDAKLQT